MEECAAAQRGRVGTNVFPIAPPVRTTFEHQRRSISAFSTRAWTAAQKLSATG
jgi:hypothetical protein